MEFTVADVAALVDGTVSGDSSQKLSGVSSLTEAIPGDISFLANSKYAPYLSETKATAVIVPEKYDNDSIIQIVVKDPDYAFAKIVAEFIPVVGRPEPGIHPTAVIGDGVSLGENISIGPYCVISRGVAIGDNSIIYPHVFIGDESRLGTDCSIYPHVTIREQSAIGNRVIIHSGAVIGGDGFGYASVEGVHNKIPQVGIVVIEDDVEIGANTTIDRARFGRTFIGTGTKIDNIVQIAHNVEIGAHCILVAQSGIAGSTRLGHHTTVAGQSGISGHLKIGDYVIIAARSGVTKNIPSQTAVMGFPAQDLKTQKTKEVAARRLPGTIQTVRDLEARVAKLEALLNDQSNDLNKDTE
ncbi:MAG: UDP-3-O-(3-hydroxymyristoyl)glucosamine N-acyltransferase [Planctomycetes bacterium]|nr:UDP-3-O-(3-hydroxymyristoyl)glucosamine N-acyltransferase [Planctomycetota bacterium]